MELVLFFLLLCKHAIADLAIQSLRPPCDKSSYLRKGLHLHAFDHSALTFLVLLFFVNPITALCIALFDYVVHLNIDCIKTNILKYFDIPRSGSKFWAIQAFDQIAHYATYFAIALYVS